MADAKNEPLPVNPQHPIWVRSRVIRDGPAFPGPASHPSCEFNLTVQGKGEVLVGNHSIHAQVDDLIVYSPGVPHWFHITRHPYEYIAIHFHPSLLFEMTPTEEGVQMLSRVTLPQNFSNTVIRPTVSQRSYFKQSFQKAKSEFERREFGWEAKLKGVLIEIIVELLRMQRSASSAHAESGSPVEWQPLPAALRHLHEHYAEPIYASDLARAAGVSESRLKSLFQHGLGMPWTRYLRDYRMRLATSLLSLPNQRVVDVALSVGFETLSHFNTAFRSYAGTTPLEFIKMLREKNRSSAAKSTTHPRRQRRV